MLLYKETKVHLVKAMVFKSPLDFKEIKPVNPKGNQEYSGLNPLRLSSLISLQFRGLSRVFSNTTVQKHQFFGTQLSL